MKIPEGWPTEEMCRAAEQSEYGSSSVPWMDGGYTPENVEGLFKVMFEAAATPPAQDDEPVLYQMRHKNFPTWVNCSKSTADRFMAYNDGHEVRPLYTRPQSDKLRAAAESFISYFSCNDERSLEEVMIFLNLYEQSLRAALGELN